MDVSKLAVSGFEGPLLVRVQVPEPDVVDHYIFDESVSR